MKRKFLEDLGLEKEVIDKIIAENESDVSTAKADQESLKQQLETVNQQIVERDNQLEELKKASGNHAELQQQITTLQTQNAEQKEAHEAEVKQLKIDTAVDAALSGAKAKNIKAVKALLDLKDASLNEDGTVKGLKEQLDKLSGTEDTKFLFDTQPPKPVFRGFQPGVASGLPDVDSTAFESRIADARKNGNTLEVIKIKQEAATQGVVLL